MTAIIFLLLSVGGCYPTALRPDASTATPEDMVAVQGGCFIMGDFTGEGEQDELPAHEVCLDSFAMERFEVSVERYRSVMGNVPTADQDCIDCPVVWVSWERADEYCKKIGRRLPTEAEWEYAARQRGESVLFGTGHDFLTDKSANFNPRSEDVSASAPGVFRAATVAVKSFAPNSLGLYQMSGNVLEWVSDWYAEDYYARSPRLNPQGPDKGMFKVLRGGSWIDAPWALMTTVRFSYLPENGSGFYGFRCVR